MYCTPPNLETWLRACMHERVSWETVVVAHDNVTMCATARTHSTSLFVFWCQISGEKLCHPFISTAGRSFDTNKGFRFYFWNACFSDGAFWLEVPVDYTNWHPLIIDCSTLLIESHTARKIHVNFSKGGFNANFKKLLKQIDLYWSAQGTGVIV